MNKYKIKDGANKGVYNGEKVIVLERNNVHGYAKIKKKASAITMNVPLSELKQI